MQKTKLFGKDIISLEERVILKAPAAICALFENYLPDHISKITGGQYVITPNLKVYFNDYIKAMNILFVNFEAVSEINELKTSEDLITFEKVMTRPASTNISKEAFINFKKEIFVFYLCQLDKGIQKQIIFRLFRDFKDESVIKSIVNRYFV